jgi:hypothetical protein
MAFFFLSGLLRQFSPPLHYPKYLEYLVYVSINRGDFIGFVAGLLVTFAFLFGFVAAMPIALILLAICIRIGATLIYLRPYIAALPRNFRRLAICTLPAQIPELVSGLNSTESRFTFKEWLDPVDFPILIFFPSAAMAISRHDQINCLVLVAIGVPRWRSEAHSETRSISLESARKLMGQDQHCVDSPLSAGVCGSQSCI